MDSLVCSSCNYIAKNAKGLSNHQRIHINLYKCESCSFQASHKKTLVAHQKKHKLDEKSYQCDQCDLKITAEEIARYYKNYEVADYLKNLI